VKIAIVGGGIFGITTAIILGKNNDVELFEKNDDILKSASGSNQYRVHRGYHYPRSPETVIGIIKSENSFKEIFSEAIITNFEHFYCISKNNSLTSSEQFINFCTKYQLEIEKTNLDCVNKNSIDLCVRVKESVYDPKILKKISTNLLSKNNVKLHLNTKATESMLDKFDKIIICTYANLNELLNKFPDSQNEYQFELCEKPVVKLSKSFKNKSIVIMDGPFMCIDPLANTDLHLLCNVQHEIHQTNVGKFHEIQKKYEHLLDNGIIKNPSHTNYDKFIKSSIEFFPEIKDAEYIGSMFTIRAVPPRAENTDERPTLVTKINEKVISIFSGKITTCVEAARQVEEMILKI
jgi:subtilase family serine protease